MMSARKELWLVSFLVGAAALRVALCLAAFPFFSDIDEDLHFDLVTRYAQLRVPRSFDFVSPATLDWIVPYASPEFLQTPDRFPNGDFGLPLWKRSGPEATEVADVTREDWGREVNFESSQPPLYYLVAGGWWRLGQGFGLHGLDSLYWIRLLNVAVMASLVWLGYAAARAVDPTRPVLRIGVAMLLAFIPQSVFFTINNDVLSPLAAGALFLCLLQWLRTAKPTVVLGALTGLALAAAYLTKLSNVPLLVVVLIAIGVRSLSLRREAAGAILPALAALALGALVPIVPWMLWEKYHFGDVTGSATKFALLTWTRKPVSDWWVHPIFSAHGLWTFWSDLLTTFWRGELKWLGRPLRSPVTDAFCAISSLFLLGVAFAGTFRDRDLPSYQRRAFLLAGLSFLACVVFFALLSIQFDFGSCINPSRSHPYFTSGRLLTGALIPFAVAYVYGMDFLFRKIRAFYPLMIIAGIMTWVTVANFFLNRAIFASAYNWFHR